MGDDVVNGPTLRRTVGSPLLRGQRVDHAQQDTCRVSNSYYFDTHGDVVLRPGTTAGTYWRAKRFPLQDYRFTTPVPSRAVEATSPGH